MTSVPLAEVVMSRWAAEKLSDDLWVHLERRLHQNAVKRGGVNRVVVREESGDTVTLRLYGEIDESIAEHIRALRMTITKIASHVEGGLGG